MAIKQIIRQGLVATHLHGPLLEARNRILKPEWWQRERRFDALLGPLVRGKCVFDIGANHGGYSARLLRAKPKRVIALEPQPSLAQGIRERLKDSPEVTVVAKAVGAAVGTISINLCEGDQVASCRSDWKEVFPDQSWTRAIDVPMTTLDELIDQFGMPDFCKVDVEGFEPEVLAGLTQPILAMSLEFTPKVPRITRAVLCRLANLGYHRINYAIHEQWSLALPKDLSPSDAEIAMIDELPLAHFGGGDIYAFIQ